MGPITVTRSVASALIKLLKRLLKRLPHLIWRVLDIALNPTAHLRQLGLVIVVQLLSACLKELRQRLTYKFDPAFRKQENAKTAEEWLAAQREIDRRDHDDDERNLTDRDREFFEQLQQRKDTYAQLVHDKDEYGLMFHLRAELMRRQAGGAGYNRDGSTWLRKHAAARDRIQTYQAAVCNALRYIASGEAPGSSRPAKRLAFINETRHAFGRTALLLSGGAAFGVKHLGVISALHRHGLLPRIICGTSAGSIVAATVCVKNEADLTNLIDDRDVIRILQNLKFFGLRRGESHVDLAQQAVNHIIASSQVGRRDSYLENQNDMSNRPPPPQPQPNREPSARRPPLDRHATGSHPLLSSRVLQNTIEELVGRDVTFLEGFDRTGRVLNITVTRSDGKAPPLLCNYLTTPHLLVYSASLASCAIPGVFEPVELMAKGRNGDIEPYFKTGGWRWTDGGLQADLPKERLTELFNVNQFIVSQVNPLAPLFVPVGGTGFPWLEEVNVFLKHQLVGLIQGVSKLGQGKLFRPGGFRGIDLVMQDYEGTVTIRPPWNLSELREFLANFDERRVGQYMDDGERATWPQLPLIRSLCEVEFTLDEVASELQGMMAASRAAQRMEGPNASGNSVGAAMGRMPSYIQLHDNVGVETDHGSPTHNPNSNRPRVEVQREHPLDAQLRGHPPRPYPVNAGSAGSFGSTRLPGVASSASLVALGALDVDDDDAPQEQQPQVMRHASYGQAPFSGA